MKIKLSKAQWETIGKTAGWMRKAQEISTDDPPAAPNISLNKPKSGTKNILFVCTGNTCRSPMAEGIAKKVFGSSYNISSAGTKDQTKSASSNAIAAMQQIGIDISGHFSHPVTKEMVDAADYIFTMDSETIGKLANLVPDATIKTKSLNIANPFGGDLNTYIKARDDIRNAINLIVVPTVST